MHALALIWMLSGLLAVLGILLVVVVVRGDDGKSGKMGFGVSLFDIIESITKKTFSKTKRLAWTMAGVALLLGLAIFLRTQRSQDAATPPPALTGMQQDRQP